MTDRTLEELRYDAKAYRGMLHDGHALRCENAADLIQQQRATIERLSAEKVELLSIMRRVEPYLDAIVCYASTMSEHEPNKIAHDFRAALSKDTQVSSSGREDNE